MRRTSSVQLDSLDKASGPHVKRHSSSPSGKIGGIADTIRNESDFQDAVVNEIALATREDALKKIQALREDVEFVSQHSTPDRSVELSQVEICVAEPAEAIVASAPVLALS